MSKIFPVLLAVMMIFSLHPAITEQNTIDTQPDIDISQGIILEITDLYILIDRGDMQLRLNIAEETAINGVPTVGAEVIATHSIAMAMSEPPQVAARSIRVFEKPITSPL